MRFALASFLGAFLLFSVQPLLGKRLLPVFGGTGAVWSACLVFFQGMLLLGYAYADTSLARLGPKMQARLHGGLLVCALVALAGAAAWSGAPLAVPAPGESGGQPALEVLGLLGRAAGVPLLALCATAPLVQGWFTLKVPGRSPFFLYALSNLGSLLALVGYPLVVEPWLGLTAQSWLWSALFLAQAVLLALCAPWRAGPEASHPAAPAPPRTPIPRALGWGGLSLVGSVLLVATTHQLSADVAAGPFLWVAPLGLYLLTFVLCFQGEAWYPRRACLLAFTASVIALVLVMYMRVGAPLWVQLGAYGGSLFFGCMLCHGELYAQRPHPSQLGRFYLASSLGGVVGSALVAWAAPAVFDSYAELPLSLAAAGAVGIVTTLRHGLVVGSASKLKRFATAGLCLIASLGVGILFLGFEDNLRRSLYRSRNFYGVIEVSESAEDDPRLRERVLHHGTTRHGAQRVAPDQRGRPLGYYVPASGVGRALEAARREKPGGLNVGILGLGMGGCALLARPGDRVRFYEINEAVISLARGQDGHFDALARSGAEVEIVPGDARLSLQRELATVGPLRLDVLLLDVFSGDAIPAHLLTREAMALYLQHLAEGGLLAAHTSNRHLGLTALFLDQAAHFGLQVARVRVEPSEDAHGSTWIILARTQAPFQRPPLSPDDPLVDALDPRRGRRVTWTDERSSVLPVLGRHPDDDEGARVR